MRHNIYSPQKDLTHGIDFKNEKIKIAPIVRKLALEKGVDLSLINGSGPGGAITKKDVERFLSKKKRKEKFYH